MLFDFLNKMSLFQLSLFNKQKAYCCYSGGSARSNHDAEVEKAGKEEHCDE